MAHQEQTDLWGRPRSRVLRGGYIVKKAAASQPIIRDVRCPHCNYVWTPRIENPKQCPRCKRYLYVPKKD